MTRLWLHLEHRFDCILARLDVLGVIRDVTVWMERRPP